MQEAPLLCRSGEFHPARRPAPANVTGVTSTRKRAPPLTVDNALKGGTYLTVLSVLRNTSIRKASDLTGVPESTIRNVVRSVEATGSVSPGKRGRKEGSCRMFTDTALEGLQDFIDENPASTLAEMKNYLSERHEISPHITTISSVLSNLKITNKTIVRVPVDRNTPLLAQERMEWALTWRYWERAGARCIYIDEAGFNLHLSSGKGWAVVGYTPEIQVPKNKEKNISLLAALIPGRPVESYHIKRGPITSEDIVTWMNNDLFPLCEREFAGQPVVIVMDNAQCHGLAVQQSITEHGYRFLKTVPYSPQTNPIERMFSQVKSFVSRRTKENGSQLIAQIQEGIRSVTSENTTNYLRAHLSVLELIQRGFLLGSDHVFKLAEGE